MLIMMLDNNLQVCSTKYLDDRESEKFHIG